MNGLWFEKVNIGIWALNWSPQLVFEPWLGLIKWAWSVQHFSRQDGVALD